MIRKKLVFTEKDRLEIKRLREELNRMTLDSDRLSPVYAGGCGEQCMVTCAHYCMTYCQESCIANCSVRCDKTCVNWLTPDYVWPYIFVS